MSVVKRKDLEKFLNNLLNIYEFQDYGPNGLQIEGAEEIRKVAFAVSATKHSVNEAVKAGADALIVHHGLFWKFHGTRPLKGPFAKRVFPLIKNDISLFGYHLPLDAHLEVGNAAGISKQLELTDIKPFGDYKGSPTGLKGKLPRKLKREELAKTLEGILNHQVIFSTPEDQETINSLAIITGGANSEWSQAMREGVDAYLTGEMSEHDWHESAEAGVTMFAGGHNATEQFGVQQLMESVQKKFSLDCLYIESKNPA
ncbi:Nif3-like dinuclear metal center hexameric protein [Halobacteriovorax sp. JY17]|uniref:Nif3-like dinuclear metal center hexameric protein n=1 Tax=Halobacteriovorax sp. JY17 TaxID=2014617 RepID=UPI000C4D8DE9|nr:Nif3-like dinuclear metal center hexameric protein [Halobacteriovorax sp. JY17]PIK15434.1 MAG: Nif3-like dinuclear metal center hexameric protein [Halobacteriovorax sp. JY17]